MCIVDTWSEVIKMAPMIKPLQTSGKFDVCILAIAQHRDFLDPDCQLSKLK
jgi:UDP-N-acetylglucosamine 2-epimerase